MFQLFLDRVLHDKKIHRLALASLPVVLATTFLSIVALFKIPFYPTPMTLQTAALFLIGLTLGSKKGFFAVFLYLIEASLGWPILAGGSSNSLWMIGPNAGFLIGFLPAVIVIAKVHERFKKKTLWTCLLAILCGQLALHVCGVSCLALFFGWKQAFISGFAPFIISIPVKALLASTLYLSGRRYLQKG